MATPQGSPADLCHVLVQWKSVGVMSRLGIAGIGVLRLGWLTHYLSHAVVSGFMTGASITIAMSQVKYLLGACLTLTLALCSHQIGACVRSEAGVTLKHLFSCACH